jgi:SAM-dependent methyltransferase
MFFLRKSSLERLPVAMSGVRMGERALQIGIDDRSLAGAIAAKVGLSGHAAFAVTSESTAAHARRAGEAAGVLVDVQVVTLPTLQPLAADAFDVIVIHAGDRSLPAIDDPASVPMLREAHRVLRSGGRVLVIEGGPRRIAGLLRPRARLVDPATSVAALSTAGFRAARPLADREGYRFTEALK